MNQKEIIESIRNETGLRKSEVTAVLEALAKTIQTELHNAREVRLSGIGTFKVKHKDARKARNPTTGEEITIPPRNVATFSPSTKLKAAL